MDITKATTQELKATAFDIMVQLEQGQNALRAINAELQKRVTAEPVKVEEVKTETPA